MNEEKERRQKKVGERKEGVERGRKEGGERKRRVACTLTSVPPRCPLLLTRRGYDGHIWRQGIRCECLWLGYKMPLPGLCMVCLVPGAGAVFKGLREL